MFRGPNEGMHPERVSQLLNHQTDARRTPVAPRADTFGRGMAYPTASSVAPPHRMAQNLGNYHDYGAPLPAVLPAPVPQQLAMSPANQAGQHLTNQSGVITELQALRSKLDSLPDVLQTAFHSSTSTSDFRRLIGQAQVQGEGAASGGNTSMQHKQSQMNTDTQSGGGHTANTLAQTPSTSLPQRMSPRPAEGLAIEKLAKLKKALVAAKFRLRGPLFKEMNELVSQNGRTLFDYHALAKILSHADLKGFNAGTQELSAGQARALVSLWDTLDKKAKKGWVRETTIFKQRLKKNKMAAPDCLGLFETTSVSRGHAKRIRRMVRQDVNPPTSGSSVTIPNVPSPMPSPTQPVRSTDMDAILMKLSADDVDRSAFETVASIYAVLGMVKEKQMQITPQACAALRSGLSEDGRILYLMQCVLDGHIDKFQAKEQAWHASAEAVRDEWKSRTYHIRAILSEGKLPAANRKDFQRNVPADPKSYLVPLEHVMQLKAQHMTESQEQEDDDVSMVEEGALSGRKRKSRRSDAHQVESEDSEQSSEDDEPKSLIKKKKKKGKRSKFNKNKH